MKKFLLLFAAVATFAFTGCYEDMGPVEPNVGNISVEQSHFEIPHSGGTFGVLVTSDYPWQASSSDSWITVHENAGSDYESILYFTVEPNYSSSERLGQIVIFSDMYNLTTEVNICQSAGYSNPDFALEVTNIGERSATFTITAKEETRTFYWSCHKKAEILAEGSTAEFMVSWHEYMQGYVDNGYYTWAELLDTGSVEYTSTKLNSDTTYILWAYGVDMNGNITSTDLSYYEFKTKPSTFDTSSWLGNWTLTPSKLFWEIIADKTWAQGIVENTNNITYTLEIADGTSEDASLAGYALIYGWDANIPDMPALGVYVDNTIEILSEEVIAADEEYLLTWLPIIVNVEDSEDFTYAAGVSSWLTPYVLTMNADGSVNVKGETGLITDGTNSFNVEVFKLEWLKDGSYLYSAIQVGDEEIIHPAGNTMTAVKSSAMLSKKSNNKNFKVMHKYANAKSAAMQFSTAVKASIIRK